MRKRRMRGGFAVDMRTVQGAEFRSAVATGTDWKAALETIMRHLGAPEPEHRLGVVYATAGFHKDLPAIEAALRDGLGVPHWVGTVGYGICAGGTEVFGAPAIAVMLLPLNEDDFRVFQIPPSGVEAGLAPHQGWIDRVTMPLILAHADPACGNLPDHIVGLSAQTGGFLVGGLSAASGCNGQIADGSAGGLSGVMISPDRVMMQTGLSQGCVPIGPARQVTAAEGHVLFEIDGRPALDVFMEDIGPELASDLEACAGTIFAALPVTGHDKADYLVRNLIGIDIENRIIAIGATREAGDPVMFCKRDGEAAVADMERMLTGLSRRVGKQPIKGGIYISCCARGPNQFSHPDREMDLIQRHLGDFPLIGFFANGEISGERMYGYTGVLTLFA